MSPNLPAGPIQVSRAAPRRGARGLFTLACIILTSSLGAQENGKPPKEPRPGTEKAPRKEEPPGRPRSQYADIQREAVAVRVPRGPVVDGRLDDEVWKLAPAGGPLVQATPYEGTEPSQLTEFRILCDDDALYIGVWCFDTEPDKIVASEMAHDGRIYADDYIAFVLDTFLDRRNGYEFRVNPNGARGESLISDNVSLNESWDCIWTAAGRIDSEGWKVEAAIPFKSLSFNPRTDLWGFNIFRYILREAEKNRWVAARPELSTYNVADAGTLRGLTDLRQGVGLDAVPYLLGKYRYDNAASDTDLTGEIGGDLRYRITPNLTAMLSYNTDFAETEVDMRQINLTRFPLYYPEKRDFFLEDSGIFRFGGLGTSLIPFYSRRIGLSEEGEVVPILAAAKVTGRFDSYNIGFLDAVLDEHAGLGVKNAFAGRLSRNILEQSSVGVLFTAGDPNTEKGNFLGGADFGFRTTSLFGDDVLQANAFFMGTATEDSTEDGSLSFGANVSLPNDLYTASAGFYQVGEGFNPALGFAPRRGIRAYSGSLGWQPRPGIYPLRQLFFTYYTSNITDLSDELETSSHSFSPVSIAFESGDYVYTSVVGVYDEPTEDFEISPGVVIPPDEYWWAYYRIGLDTSTKRPLELELDYSSGGFYDGTKNSYSGSLEVKPIRYIAFRFGYTMNQVRLSEGDFDTHLAYLRLRIGFTPQLTWYNLAQYDSVSETFGFNSRIAWEFRPGSWLYLVLTQNIERDGSDLTWLESELTAKLQVTVRF